MDFGFELYVSGCHKGNPCTYKILNNNNVPQNSICNKGEKKTISLLKQRKTSANNDGCFSYQRVHFEMCFCLSNEMRLQLKKTWWLWRRMGKTRTFYTQKQRSRRRSRTTSIYETSANGQLFYQSGFRSWRGGWCRKTFLNVGSQIVLFLNGGI